MGEKTYRAAGYKVTNNDGYWEIRYRIVNKETGNVLDDAQGYGYKTAQNAYAAYGYKHRDKSKDKERKELEKKIVAWLKEHSDFSNLMEQIAFEIMKGSWGPDDKFDAKLVRQMLKDNNLEIDFKVSDLLRVWQKN